MAYEGAAIWLFRRLRATAVFDSLPAGVTERLRAQAFEATALRMQVEAEAATSVGLLRDAGISVILIKGVARCALANRYPYLDARPTDDVDLLIEASRLADADRVLRAAGYRPALPPAAAPADHHHLPPLRRATVPVELHGSTSVHIPPELAWARANDQAEEVQWAGSVVRVPSATELARSAVLHALEDGIGGLRLKRFLEITALVSAGAPVDWALVQQSAADPEQSDPTLPADQRRNFTRAWLEAAMVFVAPDSRPAALQHPAFDEPRLLRWRLMILASGHVLGRPLSVRLLEEGARAMIQWPLEPSPPDAAPPARLRRHLAGRASRILHAAWKDTR